MELDGEITILFERGGLKIEVIDGDSRVRFLEVFLDTEQTCNALSRLAHTPCSIEVRGLDKVGKNQEYKELVFEVPENMYRGDREKVLPIAKEHCPEGWIPDTYFGSQDSFFTEDGKNYARTTIRRWV